MSKPIAIGSDEAGFDLKATILELLQQRGLGAKDYGCYSRDPIDYPDVAHKLSRPVARGEHERGIRVLARDVDMGALQMTDEVYEVPAPNYIRFANA